MPIPNNNKHFNTRHGGQYGKKGRQAKIHNVEPRKWMHEITIKHTKEQVFVHTAEMNYLGNRNAFYRLDLKDRRVGIWQSDGLGIPDGGSRK